MGKGRSRARALSRKEKLENRDWIKPALILAAGRMRWANTGITRVLPRLSFSNQGLRELERAITLLVGPKPAKMRLKPGSGWKMFSR